MSGHVAALRDKDGIVKKRKDGTAIWRGRYPDPTKGGTAQIEKRFRSKIDGEKWLKRQGVAVLDGTHVDPRNGERLLSEVVAEWRETWTDLEPKTRVGYDSILNAHIIGSPAAPARFHHAKVGGINAEVYQRWINDLAVDHAPTTVRRINTVMRAVLRVAVARRYIAPHPPRRRGEAAEEAPEHGQDVVFDAGRGPRAGRGDRPALSRGGLRRGLVRVPGGRAMGV